MANIVRAALLQATWAGDKEAMIAKHVDYARRAVAQGAQVMCFQELFYGPYFCQIQDTKYYGLTERIPYGPTTRLMQDLAKETGMVLIAPMYEEEETGVYYKHRRRHQCRWRRPGKIPQDPHPPGQGLLGEILFSAGEFGLSGVRYSRGQSRRGHLLRSPFPAGRRHAGLNGAEIVFIPSATSRGLSQHLWNIEQTSHAIANGYFVGTINRVGIEEELGRQLLLWAELFLTPVGSS